MRASDWRFVETADYRLPPGREPITVTTVDGVRLRAVRWPARLDPARITTPRGTIVLAQGRAEFIEKYAETISDLLDRGFAVVTFDWRGQGLSQRDLPDGSKGHVRHFALYRNDLDAVVAQAVPDYWPRPLFCLAHSMGGAIVLQAIANGFDRFARVALSAPMVDVMLPMAPRAARWLSRVLYRAGMGNAYIPGGGPGSISARPFSGNRLTSDPRRYARTGALIAAAEAQQIAVAIGDPTVAWLRTVFLAMDAMAEPEFTRSIHTPVLIVTAGADTVVSSAAAERLAARLKTGRAISLAGSRHEILMERDEIRAAFFGAFDAFIPGSAAEFAPRRP